MPNSYFEIRGPQSFEATEATVGPWATDFQHGGPPIALLARAMRLHQPRPGMHIARITTELLGPVPVGPCEVSVETLRPGKRIELLQGVLTAGGKPALLARAWRILNEPACAQAVPDPFEPPPRPEEETHEFFHGAASLGYFRSLEWRFFKGEYNEPGPASVWARPRIPLVEGEPTDGLEGLLILLDSANGVSAELDLQRWSFVPVDLTLNLHRQPQGPWFGMDARTMIDAGGTGLVTTAVWDAAGAVGRSLHTLFVRPR